MQLNFSLKTYYLIVSLEIKLLLFEYENLLFREIL